MNVKSSGRKGFFTEARWCSRQWKQTLSTRWTRLSTWAYSQLANKEPPLVHCDAHKDIVTCNLTAMQACASIPQRIACLGFPRACSSISTSSIIMVNWVLAWAFRSSAPSSGTVGPKPRGYCSVKMEGMPRRRLACEERVGRCAVRSR